MKIEIEDKEIREELAYRMRREPTEAELTEFKEYLQRDVQQWLVDNAKHWTKEVLPNEE